MPVDYVDALSPEERLTLATNLGTLALLAQVLFCWLFGETDPLGGMDFGASSLRAAAAGAAGALPLLACSAVARSAACRRRFPVLEQFHAAQAGLQRHFTAGLNLPQLGILLSFAVVPTLLALLPATRAGCVWSATFAQQALLQTWASGLHFPRLPLAGLAALAAPLAAAYVAAGGAAACFGVRPRALEMIRDALKNREAYFRLAAARTPPPGGDEAPRRASTSGRGRRGAPLSGPASVFASSGSLSLDVSREAATDDDDDARPPGGGERDGDGACYSAARAASDAFSTLAMVYLVSRRHVAQLAGLLSGGSVLYLAVLWRVTGDMSAPLVAALLHAALEVWYGEQQPPAQQ